MAPGVAKRRGAAAVLYAVCGIGDSCFEQLNISSVRSVVEHYARCHPPPEGTTKILFVCPACGTLLYGLPWPRLESCQSMGSSVSDATHPIPGMKDDALAPLWLHVANVFGDCPGATPGAFKVLVTPVFE